ncbi:hypothetical protein Hanom_Chr14g01306761 [Helianthus anomalus]
MQPLKLRWNDTCSSASHGYKPPTIRLFTPFSIVSFYFDLEIKNGDCFWVIWK